MDGSLLPRDLAAVDELLHHRVVAGDLPQPACVEQVGAGIPGVHHMGHAAAGVGADAGGTHALHLGVRGGLFIHGAVRDVEPAHDESFFHARLQGLHVAGKILLHGVGGNACSNAPAVDTAHAVADDAPGGAACQLLRTVIVLVFLPAAADVRDRGNLHSGWFLSAAPLRSKTYFPCASSRRSWPQAALMSVPRRRRTVALTPSASSSFWKRCTLASSVAE